MLATKHDLTIPPAKNPAQKCENCVHWMKDRAARYMVEVTPMGAQTIPLSEVLKMGLQINNDKVVTASKCTETPLWGFTVANHWCGRFQPF